MGSYTDHVRMMRRGQDEPRPRANPTPTPTQSGVDIYPNPNTKASGPVPGGGGWVGTPAEHAWWHGSGAADITGTPTPGGGEYGDMPLPPNAASYPDPSPMNPTLLAALAGMTGGLPGMYQLPSGVRRWEADDPNYQQPLDPINSGGSGTRIDPAVIELLMKFLSNRGR